VTIPTATVTFFFTDIEGSARLWEREPEAMRRALGMHDEILRGCIDGNGGYVFATGGDGFAAAFQRVGDAIRAAVSTQAALGRAPWPGETALRVRMGLHTGEAQEHKGDYFGSVVNRAARLMSLAHGGQVVVSGVTADVAGESFIGEVTLVDLGEHVLRDLSRREHVFQVSAPGMADEFPPLRSPDVLPGNLPLQPTSFVGRDDDVREVSKALGRARLVTLIGVGGVGKTRLALQVAAELLPSFADGAWLCELAAAGDADTLAQVVASTVGAAQRRGRSLSQSIVEFLAASQMMLVLDNCEHLLDASGRLAAAILGNCPGVRVVATSREALAVAGEQVWPVRSLEVPEPGESVGVAEGAVRLFCERAASARPGFELSAGNEASVVEVCRRLDGIPLAIELAAARVSAMTPTEVAGLLDERFRLLTGGRRTAVERHQTLRATVDWSYSMLAPAERVVFDRLSVFSGGFTMGAAADVVAGDGTEAWDVVDAIGGLVAKSMVVADVGADDLTRFQLLETMRQYGRERLDENGETDGWRRRHAAYFATYATELSKGLRGRDELRWRERLTADLDNLRAAVVWGLDSGADGDEQMAVHLVAQLAYQAAVRATGVGRWAEQAINAAQRSSPGLRSAVFGAAAMGAQLRGDGEASERYARAAVAEGFPSDNPEPSTGTILLAVNLMYRGQHDEAVRVFDTAEASVAERGDDFSLSALQNARVSTALFADDEGEEIAQARRAMVLAERLGNPSSLANAAYALGWALRHHDPNEAIAAFDRSIALGVRIVSLPLALSFSARIAASRGDPPAARPRMRQALELCIRDDDWYFMTGCLDAAVDLFCYLGEAEHGAILAGAVDTTFAALRFPHVGSTGPGLQVRKANLARVRAALGNTGYAQAYAEGSAMSREETVSFVLDRL
jgi:predicted ATPase/class 3 adenylate cyclase